MADSEISILIRTAFSGEGTERAIAAQQKLNELARQGNEEAARAIQLQRQAGGGLATSPSLGASEATTARLDAEAAARQRRSELANQMGNFREEAERKRAKEEQDRIASQQSAIYQNQERDRAAFRAQTAAQARAGMGGHLDQHGGGADDAGMGLGGALRTAARAGGLGYGGSLVAAGGMAGGVAAVALGIAKIGKEVSELYAKLDQLSEASRVFDLAEKRADSLANQVRRLVDHHKDLAQTYANIERQVHTVSAAVQHQLELGEAQIRFEQRMDDAQTRRESAEAGLKYQFNPVQLIREQEEIEERAFERRMERERILEQKQIDALKLKQEMAADREKQYKEEVDKIDKTLPKLEREAEIDKERIGAVEKEGALKRAELEKERKTVQELALGKGGIETLTKFQFYRTTAPQELNPSSPSSDSLFWALDPTSKATIEAAQKRLSELDSGIEGTYTNEQRARAASRQSGAAVQRATRQREMYEGEIFNSKVEQDAADRDKKNAERIRDQNETYRQQQQQQTIEAMEIEAKTRERGVYGPIHLAPTGGVSMGGGDTLTDKVAEMVDLQRQLLDKWTETA